MAQLRRPLLLFTLVPVLFGITLLSLAATERRRAAQVDATPTTIDCETLIRQGTPSNRHVRVSGCWFGGAYAYWERPDSPDWDSVYKPVYSRVVEREDEGQDIHLIARFTNVRNEQELQQATAQAGLTGCIWDDHRMGQELQEILRGYYPKIDFQQCRFIEVGNPLPTQARAKMFFLAGTATLVFAFVLAGCMAYSFAARRLGTEVAPQEQGPYAAESPHQQPMPSERDPSTVPAACLRLSHFVLPIAVSSGLVFCVLMRLGLIPSNVGKAGMWLGVAAAIISICRVCSSISKFREYVHEPRELHELPQKARRHFERHTPEIEQLEFQRITDVLLCSTTNTFVREFLSSDGKTVALLESNAVAKAITFQSIASDGVILETSNCNGSNSDDESLPKRRQIMTGSPEDLWMAHQPMVQQYEAAHQVETWAVQPDEISAVLDYEHRVIAWSLYRQGIQDNPPPPLPEFHSIDMLTSLLDREFSHDTARYEPQAELAVR